VASVDVTAGAELEVAGGVTPATRGCDRAGRLTGWNRARLPAVTYAYDARNRLVSSQGTDGWGAAGRLDRVTDAAGVVADYGFDGLDRVAARNRNAGTTPTGALDEAGWAGPAGSAVDSEVLSDLDC
jgi:YD repeat-containing protein